MPWTITNAAGAGCPADKPYAVIKSDTGENVACHSTQEEAVQHMQALYANLPGFERAGDTLAKPEIAGEATQSRQLADKPSAPIERREASVDNIDYPQRIITVIAAPYEQPAMVQYRGELWQEIFERTAWEGLTSPHRVRANRGHDKNRTVGKVTHFWPERREGLVADIKIAKTPLGDDTLALAAEDCLSTSVGFGVLPDGQHLDRATRTRRIKTAYLDHVAFVESPAYENADVIGVRGSEQESLALDDAQLIKALRLLISQQNPVEQRAGTPALNEYAADPVLRWASERLNPPG